MTNSNDPITEKIVRLMQADDSIDAPADSIKLAKNIFRRSAAEAKPSLIRKLVASLQMDLLPQKPVFGERSGGVAQARQMFFDAGDHSIDLRIKETEGGWEIHGQILGDGFAASRIEIVSKEKSYKMQASDTSEFKFAGVTGGTYEFKAIGKEIELAIETLELN